MELLFEQVRAANYPELPSRLRSAYFFANLEDARIFRSTAGRSREAIYEVELMKKEATIFWGNLLLVHPELDKKFGVGTLFENAYSYWRGDSEPTFLEGIAESPVMILNQVDEQ